MKNYILILLLLFLSACKSDKKNLDLFNGLIFELTESEKEIAMTSHIKETYLDIIKEKNLQIPLFKIVKGSNYYVFLGIPVNASLKEMIKSPLYNDSIRLQIKTDSSYYRKYRKNEYYLSEYVSENENNLIYILTITESEAISDKSLNFEKLSNRLRFKNYNK